MKPSLVTLLASTLTLVAVTACSDRERAPGQWPISRDELRTTAAGDPSEPRDDPAELTYRRYCIGCHGADGRGNAGTTGADLTTRDGPLATKSDEALIASIAG